MLAFTGDNTTSNDTQTSSLSSMTTNLFEEINRVRCFNHTMQLSAKALLSPFNTNMDKSKDTDEKAPSDKENGSDEDIPADPTPVNADTSPADEDMPDLEDTDADEVDNEDGEEDDEDDELENLTEEQRAKLLEDTKSVRFTLTKVHCYLSSFFFIFDIVIF